MINGRTTSAVPELSPQRRPLAKAQAIWSESLEREGSVLGESWKVEVDVLTKVIDIDWVAFRCALLSM